MTGAEPTVSIHANVNGLEVDRTVPARTMLSQLLRDDLGLTGTKVSCEMQVCGACTVLVDGRPVSACTFLAADVDGAAVSTVEGLAGPDELHPLQEAFVDNFALQCGFCTAGFLMMASALLERNPDPTADEVKEWLDGNLCRCTGYEPIVLAVLDAARRMKGRTNDG
ncbi:MAG TPA: (2Fe-2S)-binding protein [Micromonosporaceae bacterium]|jgi:aerobic-type carbon monoxide dehydrogenase small subunit (CoxS/CutS family)